MPAKDSTASTAIGALLALLESRFALRVLWALRDGHPQTFRLLQCSVSDLTPAMPNTPITPNTLNTRLKELRAAGLVHHAGAGYLLTPLGTDLVSRLAEVPAFAGKWATGSWQEKSGL